MTELVIRGGTVVTPDGVRQLDVAIEDGLISDLGEDLDGADDELDARGLHVLPAAIDVHLHFNEPGRTEWEGAATGSRALAAGGGAVFCDMPLNSTPCTVGAVQFDDKRRALEGSSVTDFGIWGGLVPGSIPAMAEMAACGAVGFKAFMCDSGLPEFPRADDVTLLDGMREAARLGLPVAVHAENEEITRTLAARVRGRDVRDFLASRPLIAELEAIQRALLFAHETGARLHIVHVSCGRGVRMAADARAAGTDVSIETCPHYLLLTEDDIERLGTIAKCAPPLRHESDRDSLWRELLSGNLDIVASDHSPTEPSRKSGDFMSAWGGIAGVQSTYAALLDEGHLGRDVPLERIAELLASAPAQRFGLRNKGAIAVGNEADLVLIDLERPFTLRAEDLHQRHKSSPYVGRSFRASIRRTIRRGETIFADGAIVAQTTGRLVRPASHA